jgi:hypothetical protein
MVQTTTLAAVLLLVSACSPAYPAPRACSIPLTRPPEPVSVDPGDVQRIQALEGQCRVRLEGETARASLAALDRVREVLGSGCDLETVARDPLHWLLHCRSDALFDSGEFALVSPKQGCPELGGRRVNPWMCVGAVLQGLFALEQGAALERLDLAVVGHVDMQPINPRSDSHLCPGLQQKLGYQPSPPWQPVPADAVEEERQQANNQLAWCRAASVGYQIRLGMQEASEKAGPAKARSDGGAGFELAVLGLGSSWLRSQPEGRCPSHGEKWSVRTDCGEARRVDILVRFEPASARVVSACEERGDDAAGALYCWQQCKELLAAGSHAGSGVVAESAPLFLRGSQAEAEALPAGWYLQRLPEAAGRVLDLQRVCDTLGVAGP